MSSRFVLSIHNNLSYYANFPRDMKEPANAQQSFSATCEPTVWRTIPVLEYLQETWQNMARSSKFDSLTWAIDAGLDNLCKWYRKVDDTDVYFICLGMYLIVTMFLRQP